MTAPPPEKPESPLKAEDSSRVSTEQPESPKPAAALDAGVEYALPLSPGMLQTPHIQVWQGAFPPPDAVERYESVLPGAFDRLIAMAEAAQQAQITIAAQAIAYRQRDVSRAYWLGAAVAAFAMACALLALRMGSQTVAVVSSQSRSWRLRRR